MPLLLIDPAGFVPWAYLGFLPLNWPRAFAILGDAGALPLGFLLGAQALRLPLRETLAVSIVPLCDFTQVVLARLWLGYAPWIADRRHLTHIAQNLGMPRVLIAPLIGVLVWISVSVLRC